MYMMYMVCGFTGCRSLCLYVSVVVCICVIVRLSCIHIYTQCAFSPTFSCLTHISQHKQRNSLRHGHIEEHQELPEGGLVHAVDRRHVSDEEIEDRTASCHRTILLSSSVDLPLRLRCNLQLGAHVLRGWLRVLQHHDQVFVVHQGALVEVSGICYQL